MADPYQIMKLPPSAIECPHCGASNPEQATTCGRCGGQMSRSCPVCGQPVLLGQTACVRCGTFVPEYDQRRFAEGVATEQRVQHERIESDARAEVVGEVYQATAKRGAVFLTLMVVFLCILAVLAVNVFSRFAQP